MERLSLGESLRASSGVRGFMTSVLAQRCLEKTGEGQREAINVREFLIKKQPQVTSVET